MFRIAVRLAATSASSDDVDGFQSEFKRDMRAFAYMRCARREGDGVGTDLCASMTGATGAAAAGAWARCCLGSQRPTLAFQRASARIVELGTPEPHEQLARVALACSDGCSLIFARHLGADVLVLDAHLGQRRERARA